MQRNFIEPDHSRSPGHGGCAPAHQGLLRGNHPSGTPRCGRSARTCDELNQRQGMSATQSELRFMASDNRSQQKRQSGLMLITTDWPTGMTPAGRCYMLGWMIQQLEEAKNFLCNRGLLRDMDHAALDPQFWFGVLSVNSTTVPRSYSTMTMLTFKSWDLRSAFLSRYKSRRYTVVR